MPLASIPLLLVSRAPETALRALAGTEADVVVKESVPTDVAAHQRVLLSGPLAGDEVSALIHATSRAGGQVCVDLTSLPGLSEAANAGVCVTGWQKCGSLPVAVLGQGEGVPVADLDLEALARVLPTSNLDLDDQVRRTRQRIAVRNDQLQRSRERVRRVRTRLERSQAQVALAKRTAQERAAQRDRARQRVRTLESSRELRWGRAVSGAARRVGGKRGLVLMGAGAVLLLALVMTLLVVWPRVGLALAALLGLAGVAGTGLLHLLLALRAARRPSVPASTPQPARNPVRAARPTAAQNTPPVEVLDELRRIEIEVADARNTLASVQGFARSEPARRVRDLAALRAQQQATTQLFSRYPVDAPVPAMGGWAASADLVLVLIEELRRMRPRLVVECGSGVSTLWLALAIRHHGLDTRIVSLDHDARYAAATTALLAQHGVSDIADVRFAPLTLPPLPGHETPWYDASGWSDLSDIGMLVVDGPPAATGAGVRYPAVPLLAERFAAQYSVVLDDMIRADEQRVAAQWQLQLDGVERVDLPLEKHATILRRE